MADYTKKALTELETFDPHQNKSICGICAKAYKHAKTCENHMLTAHPEHIERVAKKLTEEAKLREIIYHHQWLFTATPREITKLHTKIEEEKARLMKDFSWYLERCGEDLIKMEARLHLLIQMRRIINQAETIQDVWSGLCNFRDSLKDEVVNDFPRHNCTNEFSNIVDRLKVHAKAEFVGGSFSGGILTELIRCADKCSNWDDKQEED